MYSKISSSCYATKCNRKSDTNRFHQKTNPKAEEWGQLNIICCPYFVIPSFSKLMFCVEPLFATPQLAYHHFKRSRWRRLDKQRIQDHIICAIQNTKILITRSLPPKTTAEALTGLKYKIQYLNTPLKCLYKALIRKVRARYGDNDCLSTSSVDTHAILPHPF